MRQSENYLLDKATNENVKFFLKKWWFPSTSYNVKPLLTNHTKTRHLNSFETEMCNRLENVTITITITIMFRKNYPITTTTTTTL